MKISEILVEAHASIPKAIKYFKSFGIDVDSKPVEDKPGHIEFKVKGLTFKQTKDILDKNAFSFDQFDEDDGELLDGIDPKSKRLSIYDERTGVSSYRDNKEDDAENFGIRGITLSASSKSEFTIAVYDGDHSTED